MRVYPYKGSTTNDNNKTEINQKGLMDTILITCSLLYGQVVEQSRLYFFVLFDDVFDCYGIDLLCKSNASS